VKILIKVKPNSKKKEVNQISPNEFCVRVSAPAKEGKANQAVVELLSDYFNVPKSRITITKGFKNKNKIIEIIQK